MTPTDPYAAVAETHSAVVFFLGDRAYKVKKPVNLGFLDFSSRMQRERVCHEEVDLNRRLTDDVYLGVSDVLDPAGHPCEHLVVMRRMPSHRRLAALVQSGDVEVADVAQVAEAVARFHASLPRSPLADEAASAGSTVAKWRANTEALARMRPEDDRVAQLQAAAERYVSGRADLFAHRIACGRASDGHGDLLADDVFLLPDGPRILDCLEFDERLRVGDRLSDIAFLAMDLERLGRDDLARVLLDTHREATQDDWPPSLAHFHIAHRAVIRAKVSTIRAEQGDVEAAGTADELLDLAVRHLREGTVRLVLVGGFPGTGKSTVAEALARPLEGIVLRSDVVRRELPTSPDRDRYSASSKNATYAELLRRACPLLTHGVTVVLDATWLEPTHRRMAAELALRCSADFVELRCDAPADIAAARIRSRALRHDDPSEVTADAAEEMRRRAAPWPEATIVDTTGSVVEAVERARQAVGVERP